MNDDELLRERLRELPGPRAGIDADAVLTAARRRRRPKVAALTAAAAGAGVLIVAPFVVPGLTPLAPTGSVMSEQGADEQGSAGAPEAAQPNEGDPDAGGATESAAPADGSGDAASDPPADFAVALDPAVPFCGLAQAGDAGLALRLLEAPSTEGPDSGFARFEVTNLGTAAIAVELEPVTSYEVVDSIDPARTGGGIVGGEPLPLTLEPGESAAPDATTALLSVGVCGDGTPSAAVPLAIVSIDGGAPIGVVGDAWAGVR